MKCLVLAQDYPAPNNRYALQYIHSRNIEYLRHGITPIVLNFSAKQSYVIDGIQVLCEQDFCDEKFEILISHAINLRNHLRFIINHRAFFSTYVFFFHGHEVMKKSSYYPNTFLYKQTEVSLRHFLNRLVNDVYDVLKLTILRGFFRWIVNKKKTAFVFVSEWMKQVFISNVGLNNAFLENRSYVIPNNANDIFLQSSYNYNKLAPKADFVTIRPFDNPKYGVDIVLEIARHNPQYSFHIWGKGHFFDDIEIPENVSVFQRYFSPKELVDLLPSYRCALMPTRLDAQGVMVCEMASFGIPVITSDLDICKEMLGAFSNVYFMNNNYCAFSLQAIFSKLKASDEKQQTFAHPNTTANEIALLKRLHG